MHVDHGRKRRSINHRVSAYLLSRTGIGRKWSEVRREWASRSMANNWFTLFGVVSVALTAVLLVTGILLMFSYVPSTRLVRYEGSYLPLRGAEVSESLDSVLRISFEVPGGLLVRQAHRWAALLLPASLILQMLSTFFTGRFRRPRQWAWVLLFLVFVIALVEGWSGYALPDDMLSGTGLRIVEGIVLAIPVVGTWASALLFGGGFPGQGIEHLYPIHVAIAPLLLIALMVMRARILYAVAPARPRGPGGTARNPVAIPLWPAGAARAGGLVLTVAGLVLLISATVTVAPVWVYGPSDPGNATAGSQPDWYTGFLDGALRLVPPGWEIEWLGRTWTLAVLLPVGVVTVFLGLVAVYPFLEEWVTGDDSTHHDLDRPRNAPTRTAIGVAALVFYGTLWAAASSDLLATQFKLSLESVIALFQTAVILGPIVAFSVTRRVALGLQRKDRDLLLRGYETGRIIRLDGGELVDVLSPLSEDDRWRLMDVDHRRPLVVRPDERGRIGLLQPVRAWLSRRFLERLPPPSSSGVAASAGSDRVGTGPTTGSDE